MKNPTKIIVKNSQSPGDGVALSFAIKSLHESYPNDYAIRVDTPYNEMFEGFSFLEFFPYDKADLIWNSTYNEINQSNQKPFQFLTSVLHDLESFLKIRITPTNSSGFLPIRDEEKSWYSAIYEILGKDVPYWIINAGYKTDFTCKQWDFDRYQKIVKEFPTMTFVQIGHQDHIHPKLNGKNIINMVGKTDLRQLIRLVYNSFGVITPVSLPMMLSAGIEPHPRFKRLSRPCIIIAGGRESNTWQTLPNHHFLHTCGMLDCCDLGGCWKSRVVPIGDGDHKDNCLCLRPVSLSNGQTISKCMDMISSDDVISIIRKHMDNLEYKETLSTNKRSSNEIRYVRKR